MWPFLYAIQLFRYIDFVPLFFTMRTRNKYMWGSEEEVKCISKRRNSQEALFLCPQLYWGDFVCVLLYCWPEQEAAWESLVVHCELSLLAGATPGFCDSSVCDCSQNVSSIIVPRCLSSDSLVLLENRSLKSCSENGIKELVPVRSSIGRGISSSPSSSSLAWLSDLSRCVGS